MADDSGWAAAWAGAALPALIGESGFFAEMVRYTPDGGTASDIQAGVELEPEAVDEDEMGLQKVVGATIALCTDDVSDPGWGDQVVVRDTTLFVVEVVEREGTMATVRAVSPSRFEESRGGFRASVRG